MEKYVCEVNELAHYIVDKCSNDGKPVSNLQLQKMLYFLQSVYCSATNGELLFEDEFEAWPYGPVIRSVYREFSIYGGDTIDERYPVELEMPPEIKAFIDQGIEVLRDKSPWDLVKTSHAPGSPWDRVYRDGKGCRDVIPNSMIIEAYGKQFR